MREVRARLREMSRSGLFPAAAGLYALFLLFMLIQKTVNRDSGYYQPEIVTPCYMSAYVPVLLCTTGRAVMCVTAGLLSARPFENNTAAHYLLRGGRTGYIRSLLTAQLITAAAAAAGFTALLTVCAALIRPAADAFSLPDLLMWLGTALLFNCYNSMTALLIGFICSGTTAAVAGGLLIPVGISLAAKVSPLIRTLSGTAFRSGLLAGVFRILSVRGDLQVTFPAQAAVNVWPGILYLSGWILLVSVLLHLAGRKKEFPS